MKREILFRGKRVDNNEWVYGYFYYENVSMGDIALIRSNYNKDNQVHWGSIGQFTGLTDKNGVKIFEGDILLCKKATEPEEKGFECIFKDNAFRFVNRNYPNKKHFNIKLNKYDYIKEQLEIIGNIHD